MKIAVPIREKKQANVLKTLNRLAGKVDLAEIWLDQIKDLELEELLKNTPIPVICVCKKPIEGGQFKGTYKQAQKLLLEASKYGAQYIDLPLKGMESKFEVRSSKLIVSYHNFTKTPSSSELLKKAQEMMKKGAAIVKIAVKANSLDDTLSLILLAQQLQAMGIPHILISMGKKGVLSRILTPFLGGSIMFAPLDSTKTTAPGQLTVTELRKAWNLVCTP